MKFYDSRNLNCRHSWMMYKKSHILAEQYYKIKRGREFLLSNFLKNITGTTLSIDNFFPGTVSYEFENARSFWSTLFDTNPNFIGNYRDIDTSHKFDAVIALGQQLFRYKTFDESVEQLTYLKQFTKKSMFVCLPIQTLQYHRLKYSESQITNSIITEAGLQKVDSISDLVYNTIYIWLTIKT